MMPKKIKILIVGMYDNPGGIENMIFNYVSHIKSDKFDFAFLNVYEKMCYQDDFEKMGYKVFTLINPQKKPFEFFAEFLKLCENENFDIIHINMLSAANTLPLLAAKISGNKKIIFHSHNGNTVGFHRHILHFCGKFFVNILTDYKFACSNAAAKFMFGGDYLQNVKIINNAIDTSKFKFDENFRKKIRKELNVLPNDFLIGHIGRFEAQKNHSFLIKIFKKVSEKLPNAKLILVGAGYAMDEAKKLAEDLNISDKIIFYGKSDKTFEIYSALDLFLFPSLFEGLPLVGIEAQCNGLPILASTGISKEMQITDLVSWSSLTENEDVWAKKVINILQNSAQKDCLEQIENAGYSIEKEAIKLEKIYCEIAERKLK